MAQTNNTFLTGVNVEYEEIADIIGIENMGEFLRINKLSRNPSIAEAIRLRDTEASKQYLDSPTNLIPNPAYTGYSPTNKVSYVKKVEILASLQGDSDVFYHAANMTESDWAYYEAFGAFPGTVRIPGNGLFFFEGRLGNRIPLSAQTYEDLMSRFSTGGVFLDGSSDEIVATVPRPPRQAGTWPFEVPKDVTIAISTLPIAYMNIPCWPEEVNDSMKANYTTMTDTLYQYEPWQIYVNSGERSLTLNFKMHRDMWSGDHRDGAYKALIQYCQAGVYVNFKGAIIDPPITTITVGKSVRIRGILTQVSVDSSGPISTYDADYLQKDLTLTITEVSQAVLSTSSVYGGLGSIR